MNNQHLHFKNIHEKFDLYEKEQNKQTDDAFVATVKTNDSITNVVTADKLRVIQSGTLRVAKEFLQHTYGPMGSNTKIISGNDVNNISSAYSKDGLKVLKSIKFSGPIEASIIEELIDITRHVESKVGDGTTSTVILSSLIFDKLNLIQNRYCLPPHALVSKFEAVVEKIKGIVSAHGKECTPEDIYDISMISTNSNEEVSENMKYIYEKFGNNVDVSVGISNSTESVLKVYDGLTVNEGMSDPAYVNNRENNTCEIRNPYIYYFDDPVDTMDMIGLFETIISKNIFEPLRSGDEPIPTVICTPKISRDAAAVLKTLCSALYNYDTSGNTVNKPPICVITNLVAADELIMKDIADLCGCKAIKKYIDPKIYEKDKEAGLAATPETVIDFAGQAELVVSDNSKTKFINPANMLDEKGHTTPIYNTMVQFLETEIKTEDPTADANEKGLLRKRLSALKANIVDYLVGGITIADRDATKDLVEDAIKNCKSAAEYGVGYAANFEGFRAAYLIATEFKDLDDVDRDIIDAILYAYEEASRILYSSVANFDESDIYATLDQDYPLNIRTGEVFASDGYEDYNKSVKCSIMLDIEVLNTVSKIISMMATCNQCLLQAPQLNKY